MTLEMKIQEEGSKALAMGKEEGRRERSIQVFEEVLDNNTPIEKAKKSWNQ